MLTSYRIRHILNPSIFVIFWCFQLILLLLCFWDMHLASKAHPPRCISDDRLLATSVRREWQMSNKVRHSHALTTCKQCLPTATKLTPPDPSSDVPKSKFFGATSSGAELLVELGRRTFLTRTSRKTLVRRRFLWSNFDRRTWLEGVLSNPTSRDDFATRCGWISGRTASDVSILQKLNEKTLPRNIRHDEIRADKEPKIEWQLEGVFCTKC